MFCTEYDDWWCLTIKIVQGDFFHWYPPISVPKWKLPTSQSQLLFQYILLLKKAVIGCLAVFLSVLKLGGTSEKNHPVSSHTVYFEWGGLKYQRCHIWYIYQNAELVLFLKFHSHSFFPFFLILGRSVALLS